MMLRTHSLAWAFFSRGDFGVTEESRNTTFLSLQLALFLCRYMVEPVKDRKKQALLSV